MVILRFRGLLLLILFYSGPFFFSFPVCTMMRERSHSPISVLLPSPCSVPSPLLNFLPLSSNSRFVALVCENWFDEFLIFSLPSIPPSVTLLVTLFLLSLPFPSLPTFSCLLPCFSSVFDSSLYLCSSFFVPFFLENHDADNLAMMLRSLHSNWHELRFSSSNEGSEGSKWSTNVAQRYSQRDQERTMMIIVIKQDK